MGVPRSLGRCPDARTIRLIVRYVPRPEERGQVHGHVHVRQGDFPRVQSLGDAIDLLQARDDISTRRRGLVEVDHPDTTLLDGSYSVDLRIVLRRNYFRRNSSTSATSR